MWVIIWSLAIVLSLCILTFLQARESKLYRELDLVDFFTTIDVQTNQKEN